MRKIKAILFDMDGVLIDAKEWHYEALNEALRLFGVEISRYDHLHTFDGLPTKVKLEMLGEQNFLPQELHSFINNVKQKTLYEWLMKNVIQCSIMNMLYLGYLQKVIKLQYAQIL